MEKTQEEKDQELIRDIEKKIEEVVELLALKKDVDDVDKELECIQSEKDKSKDSRDMAWLPHKSHKNVAINKNTKVNMDLIKTLKHRQKLLENPSDLLKHLDNLTERLLVVVQRQCKKPRTKK
jgi:hypothetical protein